jgi:uncharacterized protein
MNRSEPPQSQPKQPAKSRNPARSKAPHNRHREELLDEALEESFPASDPPSVE